MDFIKEKIKEFFSAVKEDILKIDYKKIFTNNVNLLLFAIALILIAVVVTKINLYLLIQGVLCSVVFYFVFLWRK